MHSSAHRPPARAAAALMCVVCACGAEGPPYGNLNYPATSTHGERPSLSCIIAPQPLWHFFGVYRVGRIWVFRGQNLHEAVGDGPAPNGPPTIKCSVGPCWMMLILT